MFNTDEKIKDDILKAIGLELMFCTPEKCANAEGITAIELARKLKYPTELVKKKLKILFDKRIVKVIGINPKFWSFDDFYFQKMDEDDPVYRLLCDFDDVDFNQYFEY
ncbi:MAG: hypothetical protein PHX18_06120 [Candidatus Gastranaerophilales bacterium]|nr:hypothetical protein [Candidatus Gastranaerophilales bacterium]